MTKRKPRPKPAPFIVPPLPQIDPVVAPLPRVRWYTDDRGQTDIAEVGVPLVIVGILAISAYATVANHQTFNAAEVGGGCAAAITALLASRWGNAKMLSAPQPPSTVTTVQQTQVTTP